MKRGKNIWPTSTIAERLEYLRREIRAECISYGEIAELQSLAEHIDADDVELLQWAGVEERTYCNDPRHETPCPHSANQPCPACVLECGKD